MEIRYQGVHNLPVPGVSSVLVILYFSQTNREGYAKVNTWKHAMMRGVKALGQEGHLSIKERRDEQFIHLGLSAAEGREPMKQWLAPAAARGHVGESGPRNRGELGGPAG